jgi:hypothetical protein
MASKVERRPPPAGKARVKFRHPFLMLAEAGKRGAA